MKQRLTGTIVLGCLALIFIPLLLDGEGVAPVRMNQQVPQSPAVSPEPIPEPERPRIISDFTEETANPSPIADETSLLPVFTPPQAVDTDQAAEEEPQNLQAGNISEPDDTLPAFDAAGLPESWTVRVGIFSEAANAQTLLTSLLGQGYKAYTAQVRGGERTFTGVFVGPVLTRAEANTLKSDLDANLGENTIVSRYSIEELQL